MLSLLSIDVGFDVRATGHLVRLAGWRAGVKYHPEPGSCMDTAECRTACIETMAETLAKAGYSVVVATTANGRDVQCTPQELAPAGDRPGYEWSGPAWAIQAKNDNYWCLGPSLFAVLSRSGWRDSELAELESGEPVAVVQPDRFYVVDEETGERVSGHDKENVAMAAAERHARETGHDASVWVGSEEKMTNTGYYVESE